MIRFIRSLSQSQSISRHCYAYDPRGSKFDGEGYYEPWMKEEEEKAQFDKFYEIYDIDESSPYFVPKENRLPIF